MSQYKLLGIIFSFLLLACGGSKGVSAHKNKTPDVSIDSNNEVAIAGAINFEDDSSLSIYSSILKNTSTGKTGAYIGYKMDQLATSFKNKLKPSELLRVGEGIILEFSSSSGLTFETGKSLLNNDSKQILNVIASSLLEYPKIDVIIETHTDTSGKELINKELSQKRVSTIQNYLIEQGVANKRIKIRGFGESNPKVDEENSKNKLINRRVEFGFYASESLKKEARENTQ